MKRKLMGSCKLKNEDCQLGERAVDFGAGEIERLGNERDGSLRHAAEPLLQRMQDGEGRSFEMPVPRDDFARALGVPWLVSWHAQPLF